MTISKGSNSPSLPSEHSALAVQLRRAIMSLPSPVMTIYAADDEQRGKEPEPVPNLSPRLVIESSVEDDGIRPLLGAFWLSPDIWVETNNGVVVPSGQIQAGDEYRIAVKVWNKGYGATFGATVEFYWGDPSTDIQGGMLTEVAPAVSGLMIQPGDYVTVRSALWVPVIVNGGHECLVVRAYDDLFDPPLADSPPGSDFHAGMNRHVAQKNISKIRAVAGEHVLIPLFVENSSDAHQHTRILVQEVSVSEGPARVPRKLLYLGVLRKDLTLPRNIHPDFSRMVDRVLDFTLAPGERRRLEVAGAVPNDGVPGEQISVRVSKFVGCCISGGIDRVIEIV